MPILEMMGSIETHSISESIQFSTSSVMDGVQSSALERITTRHAHTHNRRSILRDPDDGTYTPPRS
jgi:hypothetical protein